jgi:hypothetical protein
MRELILEVIASMDSAGYEAGQLFRSLPLMPDEARMLKSKKGLELTWLVLVRHDRACFFLLRVVKPGTLLGT